MSASLHIRLLGELSVLSGERSLALPPSKKTRALLGYLVLTGRAHRRERLCELLWDVADDPRAALRWSLSKLRELVDQAETKRLVSTREHVQLGLEGVLVDVAEVKRLAQGPLANVPTEQLEQALSHFRGELLEGLELPDFHAFHAFCLAEREALRGLAARILCELLERTRARPEQALPLARKWVDIEPSSERARALLLQLLHASGREREAALESSQGGRLIGRTGGELASAEREQPASRESVLGRRSELEEPLFGRRNELAQLREHAQRASESARVVLITGAAGIGKSRLARRLAKSSRAQLGFVGAGAAYELDPGFLYAPFRDPLAALGVSLEAERALHASPEETRAQLFERVVAALEARAGAGTPLLALDDLHWFDQSSLRLLHHIVRAFRGRPLLVVLTARAGELGDNAEARRLVRVLKSERVLWELALPPLSLEETRELVRATVVTEEPELAEVVYAQSGGHPLFALELARAPENSLAGVPTSIAHLVRERMESLTPELKEVLRWGSVLGQSFQLDTLRALLKLDAEALVDALEQLERLDWLRLSAGAGGEASFAHALVHRAVYDALSEPRRRLMHGRIAGELRALAQHEGPLAAELARHAVLAGEAEMAVRACLAAGRRALALFAGADALALARRGLGYVGELPLPERCLLELELLELSVLARRPTSSEQIDQRVAELTERALLLGKTEHARRGFFIRSFLRWEEGNAYDAQRFSLEAERISRSGEPAERIRALADAARCLALLERDFTEAEAFVLEAEALHDTREPESAGLVLARGMLLHHRGAYERAREELERAARAARAQVHPLYEFTALEWLVELELCCARHSRAEAHAATLIELAQRLREGSELPFARAVHALARELAGRGDEHTLSSALAALMDADAKQRSAYVLARWAEHALTHGALDSARERAERALALALAVERTTEEVVARSVLCRVAAASGQPGLCERACAPLRALSHEALSVRARNALSEALGAVPSKLEEHGARHRRARLR